MWLHKDMQWYAPASGECGRYRTFSDAAIQFSLSIKCLFGLALRQSLGLARLCLRQLSVPAEVRHRGAPPLLLVPTGSTALLNHSSPLGSGAGCPAFSSKTRRAQAYPNAHSSTYFRLLTNRRVASVLLMR